MKKEQIENAINKELEKRGKKVVNLNALSALLGAFNDPVGSLGKIFIGRIDALETEESRIKTDIMLDLLCDIDKAISKAANNASKHGLERTIISGTIAAYGKDVEEVTGVKITTTAELKPGTHIKASGERVKKVTGLDVRMGNSQKEDE